MRGEAFLHTFHALVPLSSLMQNDVDDFVMLAYILRRLRHELVHNIAEERDIATCIPAYPRHEFRNCALVLLYVQWPSYQNLSRFHAPLRYPRGR